MGNCVWCGTSKPTPGMCDACYTRETSKLQDIASASEVTRVDLLVFALYVVGCFVAVLPLLGR